MSELQIEHNQIGLVARMQRCHVAQPGCAHHADAIILQKILHQAAKMMVVVDVEACDIVRQLDFVSM
ncbi:putative naringenin-chalcone synthase [Bradyrhizobium sp. USDA 10063]